MKNNHNQGTSTGYDETTIEVDDRSDETEQEPASETKPSTSCPECGGQIVCDEDHGESEYEECSLLYMDYLVSESNS